MNPERIEINGEWYVKENTIEPLINPEDVTHSIECVWENSNWGFAASLIAKEDDFNDCYDDVTVKITDKRIKGRENWIETDVENPKWIWSVLENNPESREDANEMFDKGWLKK